jgi:outer membrane usher protein
MCIDDNGNTWRKPTNDNQELPDHPTQAVPARPVSRPIYEKLIPEFGAGDHTAQKAKPSPEAGKAPAGAPSLREIVAAVRINDHLVNEFALLAEDENGHFYAGLDVISATRLSARPTQSIHLHGRDYYSLDSISGLTYKFDGRSQSLSISIASSRFAESVLGIPRASRLEPTVPSPGMFFNHDIEFTHSPGENVATGLLETGFFSEAGVLTSQFVSRDFQDASQFARLQTQLIRDIPAKRVSLQIGDSTSAVNDWSRQVYYAGVRWASKFATDPSFAPYAMPAIRGEATQPSTVDLYVNSIRTVSQPVDAGPFSIPTVPVMTGMGNIQLVVTDVMGRQQVIDTSYISTPQLLRRGVSNYTYEAGTLRRNLGITSDQYNSIFGAGTDHYGLSDQVTLNGRLELLPVSQTLGVGAACALLPLGLLAGDIATSHSEAGAGVLAYAQFQHSARYFGYSGTVQVTSSTFRQLGLLPGERPSRIIAQGQISRAIGNHGSMAIGYLHKEDRLPLVGPPPPDFLSSFDAITPSANVRIGRTAVLSASVNYSPSFSAGNSATLALVIPLGARRSVTSMGTIQDSGSISTTEYSQQLPIGTGYGYRVRATSDTTNDTTARIDGDFSYQDDHGTYDFQADEAQGQTSWRFTERSSLIWMQKQLAISRWLTDSFALVEADGAQNIKVYANNQYVATTNGHGLAVIPNLVSYDRNTVRLDDSGAPLELEMDLAEKTVAPMTRSGVLLKFKAAKVEGALIQLKTPDGSDVPQEAEVRVNDGPTTYFVALRGEVFVTDISFPARLEATWGDHTCTATVAGESTNEPLPRIGPIICEVK